MKSFVALKLHPTTTQKQTIDPNRFFFLSPCSIVSRICYFLFSFSFYMCMWCISGAQWGDEGKGKVVDMLATEADVVCRCQVRFLRYIYIIIIIIFQCILFSCQTADKQFVFQQSLFLYFWRAYILLRMKNNYVGKLQID